jgi:hypothetical protein
MTWWAHRPARCTGPKRRGFYEMLTRNITTEKMDVSHAWYGDDCCTIEHQWLGTEPGEFLGIPGTDGRSRSACCTSLSSSKDESHARTCGSTATRSSPSYLAQPERRPAPQGRRPVQGTERLAQRLVLSTAASASKVEGTSEQYAHTQRFSRGEAPCVNQDLDVARDDGLGQARAVRRSQTQASPLSRTATIRRALASGLLVRGTPPGA